MFYIIIFDVLFTYFNFCHMTLMFTFQLRTLIPLKAQGVDSREVFGVRPLRIEKVKLLC